MIESILFIITIALLVISVVFLVEGYLSDKRFRQFSLDEQRQIIADAEAIRQEAFDTYHKMLQESIKLSRQDYHKRCKDMTEQESAEDSSKEPPD